MNRKFWIGEWLVEPDLNQISRHAEVKPIEPKVIELLAFLADHPGEVLPKERILKTVWANTFVSDSVLTHSISELRKAFGDDAKDPIVIQTIPRRGYRLIAPVEQRESDPKEQPSIAVLAFSDMSPGKDQGYFCDGIAEEIINNLTQIEGLRVAARTSAFSFKNKPEDVRTIGRKLGVETVLEGSVRKAADRLRITAQLINVEDGCHLWSRRYDRESKDVFSIQDEIALKIVQALEVELSETEKSRLARVPTKSIEAFEFYLRGRHYFYRSKRKSIECALEMFSRATAKDPSYAQAFAGMADCYSYLYMYFDNSRLFLELANEMSRLALEADPNLAEAHSSFGLAISLSKQYRRAEEEFQTAIRLNPRLFEAYYFYARTCYVQGKWDDAAQFYLQAERVKPEDCQASSLLGFTYRSLGRLKQAEAAQRRTLAKAERHLQLNPDDSRVLYIGATALLELGETAKAMDWVKKAYSQDPEDPYILYGIACFHARLDKIEEAVDFFSQAVHAGFAHDEWIRNDSDLDPLRSHPRYQVLMEGIESRKQVARDGDGKPATEEAASESLLENSLEF